jgi:hypothetical protein
MLTQNTIIYMAYICAARSLAEQRNPSRRNVACSTSCVVDNHMTTAQNLLLSCVLVTAVSARHEFAAMVALHGVVNPKT